MTLSQFGSIYSQQYFCQITSLLHYNSAQGPATLCQDFTAQYYNATRKKKIRKIFRLNNNTGKTNLCVAPAKHLAFKPVLTHAALSQGLPPLLPLTSSTSDDGVLVSALTFLADPLAETAPVTGVSGLPGSGADKRLSFETLCLPAVE